MQFWPKSSGCCCGEGEGCGVVTGTATACQSTIPLAGASVVLKYGSTVISSGTTEDDGSYSLPFEEDGESATVTFTHPHFTSRTIGVANSVDGTGFGGRTRCAVGTNTADATLTGNDVDLTCICLNLEAGCQGYQSIRPGTLYLTDAFGTIPLTVGGNGWTACVLRTAPSWDAGIGGGIFSWYCESDAGSGPVPVFYDFYCSGVPGSGEYELQLGWYQCDGAGGSPNSLVAGNTCTSITEGNTRVHGAGGANSTNCDPLAVSFTMNFATHEAIRDLYGASASFEVTE